MGSVSTPALAVAVAEAGGVGSITAMGLAPAELDQLLARLAARTSGVLAANFMTGQIDPEAVAAAAPRCATVARARVLRSCVHALRGRAGESG